MVGLTIDVPSDGEGESMGIPTARTRGRNKTTLDRSSGVAPQVCRRLRGKQPNPNANSQATTASRRQTANQKPAAATASRRPKARLPKKTQGRVGQQKKSQGTSTVGPPSSVVHRKTFSTKRRKEAWVMAVIDGSPPSRFVAGQSEKTCSNYHGNVIGLCNRINNGGCTTVTEAKNFLAQAADAAR